MNLEIIMLHERSQSPYYMIPFIGKSRVGKSMETESRIWERGEGGKEGVVAETEEVSF